MAVMQLKGLHRAGLGHSRRTQRTRRFVFGRRIEYRWDFFQDPDGHWRWQKFDRDGNLVALSPESFRYAIECVHNAEADGLVVGEAIRFARMLNTRARISK
jgi:hypothetical protein